jgi:hypothetical protein
MQVTLTQSLYEPFVMPTGATDLELYNDHTGTVELCDVSAGEYGQVVRVRNVGNHGTPGIYLGTEGTQTLKQPNGDPLTPRAIPLDEVAVLTWDGSFWVVTWE